ncbi:MAG: radical SAM family heme chaperone HemW [Gracilibacteraceae bacterium]|jgi:oxygen-independent coproporphyrinogen-3 oxidase|nr:radical SAM family heme chaperone HemW [Gracilibacteraceae bacterium]
MLLYIHVPFCAQKCAYCAFYSEAGERAAPAARREYLAALALDFERAVSGETFDTLYLGGGTPTALSPAELAELTDITRRAVFAPGAEKTAEANPGSLTEEKLAVLRAGGFNRLSLGVQSLSDTLLARIGRRHRADDVWRALRLARCAGFSNIGADLLFGLPGQTDADWQTAVRALTDAGLSHLSLYALTPEEGTPLAADLAAGRTRLPDDDAQADMYAWAREYLAGAGYRQDEISNFSLPGRACRHNAGYWRGEEYLGLGAGAVSCLTERSQPVRTRRATLKEYAALLRAGLPPLAAEGAEPLDRETRIKEYVMLRLRTREGLDRREFSRRFGASLADVFGETPAELIRARLLLSEGDVLRLDPDRYFVANSILVKFM